MSRSRDRSETPSYAVGYKRPPSHTRFQKGVSGNPNGRPKKTKLAHDLLREELGSLITIHERGRETSITKRGAFFKSLVARAIKGDGRAAAQLLDIIDKMDASETATSRRDHRAISRAGVRDGRLFPMTPEEWEAKFGPGANTPKAPEDYQRMSDEQIVRALDILRKKTDFLFQDRKPGDQ